MRYRFGRFELHEDTRELRADGCAVPVEPQVFDLLAHLIRNRDRVLTRDDLIAAIWDGRIVSDSAIGARISAARAAIGDDGQQQGWIRTLPRRGFRFVGAVEIIGGPAPEVSEAEVAQRIGFTLSRDGTRIAYAISGAGYPLVRAGHWLTHLDNDWASPVWRPLLAALSRSYRLVRYDQRGNGLSDWALRSVDLEHLVDDLEAVVEAAGLDRFALYGTSQGGPVAIAYACRHPGRVSHLILHGGFETGRLLRASPAEREQAEAILTLMRHGWGQPGSAFVQAFATLFIPDSTREQIESLASLQSRSTSAQNAAALRRAVDRLDVSTLTPDVQAPTLVFHATGDSVQPFEQGRQLAARIKGAEFVPLESRNHIVLEHEPVWQMFHEHLRRFVPPKAGR